MIKAPLSFLLLVLLLTATSYGQSAKSTLLEDLLDLPAPPPIKPNSDEKREHPPEFYDTQNVPPDDAPIEDLLDYWEFQSQNYRELGYNIKPTQRTSQRILEACETDPEKLTNFLRILPPKKEFIERVKRLFDEEENADKQEANWKQQVTEWLTYNSKHFSDELLKTAQNVKDEKEYVSNQRELLALAKVDWENAKPLLERLENDKSQPVSSTLAMWAFYSHALDAGDESEADKYRDKLKAIVENRNAMPGARDLAMDALVKEKEWQGRDDWYLSLLADETLYELKVNGQTYTGLTTLMLYSPTEKWVSKMVKLVSGSNPTVRNAAVRNLVALLDRNNKEVVEALLPWLSNPKWARELGNERITLIHALGEVKIPESIPDLILVLSTEDDSHRLAAAATLEMYKDARAVPALRAALQKAEDEESREFFIKALVACGGFTDDEQLAYIEAYAKMDSEDEGYGKAEDVFFLIDSLDIRKRLVINENDNPLPLPISIGRVLSNQEEPGDGLVLKLIARLKELRKTDVKTATTLEEIMRKWQSRVIDLEFLSRIDSGKADIETVLNVLIRRKELLKRVPNEIAVMLTKGGMVRGLGAVLSNDPIVMLDVLSGHDTQAKIAMLACARLARAPLSVRNVSAYLNDENKLLALSAERYLESEDSVEAQNYVLEKHPNEALILGARNAFTPTDKPKTAQGLEELFKSVSDTFFAGGNFSKLNKIEEKLRTEIKENSDLIETYALLENSEHGHIVIRIYKNKAVLTWYENKARYREIVLSDEDLNSLRRIIQLNKIEDMPPVLDESGGYSGRYGNEFLFLNRKGGRRVFIQPVSLPKSIEELVRSFSEFSLREDFKLFYLFANKVKGLEIVLANNRLDAIAVWKNGNDFRVLVEDNEKKEAVLQELIKKQMAEIKEVANETDEARQARYTNLALRQQEAQFLHFSWLKIENGKLGNAVEQPAEVPYFGQATQINGFNILNQNRQSPAKGKDFEIRVTSYNEDSGLWKISDSQKPVLIKKGFYSSPILTPDEKWVAATKHYYEEGERNTSVRINLQTGKEFTIANPPNSRFHPVINLPLHNKILFAKLTEHEKKDSDKATDAKKSDAKIKELIELVEANEEELENFVMADYKIEYFTLDANTGMMQTAKGEFRPLSHPTFRQLQPTGNPNEYWAAISDKNITEIGRYNTKTFEFKPVLKIPDIEFNSMDLWVEEKEGKIYFVYEGHLLSVPFENK